MLRCCTISVLVSYLLVTVLAQATATPGIWTNQTIYADQLHQISGPQPGWPFMFTYPIVPVGNDYIFQLEISFVDIVEDFYVRLFFPPFSLL
jgi:hypothetical protein